MAINPFQKDIATIERADTALSGAEEDATVLRDHLAALVQVNRKTVKRAEKLVRVSDRTEARMREASARIEAQQVELEAANAKLANQAEILETQVSARTSELRLERAKLAKLVDLGIAMSAERDEATLLWLILAGAMELTNADGGTFYLMNEEQTALQFQILKNRTLNIEMGTDPDHPVKLPPVPLFTEDGKTPNHNNVVTSAVWRRETVNISDAYTSTEFDFSGTKRFDEANGYRSQSFLTVPLIPRGGSVLGALQLINATLPDDGTVIPFDEELQGFVEALAAQGAVTIDNQKLLVAQRNLMDSFIELIAGAIDAKSPYTGGHCNRVPELAMMLAERAHSAKQGPFADFRFRDEEEWREFRIGAWLHDCGKVTTPEYVVDKATKLETIYNRIHEIRMRFEVAYRDCRIERLEAQLAESGAPPVPDAILAADLADLREEFEFVAKTNIGGEFLDDSAVERLAKIGTRGWTRYFDDRLGLSRDEERRLADEPASPLPAAETLLSDKSSHIVPRDEATIQRLRERGFRMDIPGNDSNSGELYNLSIQRGTLTAEERFKINEHIIQTIMMLETLPFPAHLRRVPEYAGGHHETMIGTGYPRKLTREEMSVPARIMAIADIFEALTAADRPYKKAKSLSEALRIMGFMCKDRHIDPELYVLFLEDGVYMRYAKEYLAPSQIDTVQIDGFLADARACCADYA